MKIDSPNEAEPLMPGKSQRAERFLSSVAWVIAIAFAAFALYLGWGLKQGQIVLAGGLLSSGGVPQGRQGVLSGVQQAVPDVIQINSTEIMPELIHSDQSQSVLRRLNFHTIFPNRPRGEVVEYTVGLGDSVFEIAAKFNIKPETVLWGNYAQLNDNPDLISIGMVLLIAPVDGVLYQWQPGDTLEAVVARFDATPESVLNWPGNKLDLVNPQIQPGMLIMVPGGHREFRQWLIPTIPRGSAGVASSVYGGGACEGGYEGAYGTGTFIWPAGNHILSGNDYWSGHLGIDIAAGDGAPIYAADSGVVVFAGWANGGYGSTVMIDHGNGYQTLYAHLNSVNTACGRSVTQGATIGFAGSTGNSTGTHLHFEVRYQGGFISPWYVLPAP